MRIFRKNITENITANIIWQYVSVTKNKYSNLDNVLIFNSPYKQNGMNKITEMVMVINGTKTRIDCKYFSKGSNYVNTIANDILSMSYCDEENILFVLDGEGSDNILIKNIENDYKKIAPNKNISFINLYDLDNYIQNKYSILPDWEKRSELCLSLEISQPF